MDVTNGLAVAVTSAIAKMPDIISRIQAAGAADEALALQGVHQELTGVMAALSSDEGALLQRVDQLLSQISQLLGLLSRVDGATVKITLAPVP